MTSKEKFIEWVAIKMDTEEVENDIREYFEQFKSEKPKSKFTDKGRVILSFMRENKENKNNLFTARSIGDEIFMSPRTVSGSMRKLVNDGYVEKIKGDVSLTYSVTETGEQVDLNS